MNVSNGTPLLGPIYRNLAVQAPLKLDQKNSYLIKLERDAVRVLKRISGSC